MKVFIDESLSRELARRLNELGFDAVHPIHVGRRGDPDHVVFSRCLDEDRIIVTQNGRDFRKLAAVAEMHPGLIILPCVAREQSWMLLMSAFEHLRTIEDGRTFMVNRVIEIGIDGTLTVFELP